MLKRILSALIFAGCIVTQSGLASAQAPTPVCASSECAVRAFEAEVMNAYNRGNAAKAARHYATEAVVFIPGQPATRGRDAITRNIARFMEDANFKLGYTNEALWVAGSDDMAYTRGKLQVTYTDPETRTARTIRSNYLLVMRRDPGQGWQVLEDVSF